MIERDPIALAKILPATAQPMSEVVERRLRLFNYLATWIQKAKWR